MTDSDAYLGSVLEVRTNADDLNETPVGDLDWRQAATALHHLRLARQTLSVTEDALTRHIAEQWREHGIRDAQEIEGVGTVQVRRGKDRKAWQHDQLGPAVVDARLAAAEGEVPDPFTVAAWVLEAAAPSYWRTGVLKGLGIDPDEYAEVAPGRPTVQITTNDSIGATSA